MGAEGMHEKREGGVLCLGLRGKGVIWRAEGKERTYGG